MTSLCCMCQLHAFERTVYLQKLKVKGKSDNYKCRIDCQLLWKKKKYPISQYCKNLPAL